MRRRHFNFLCASMAFGLVVFTSTLVWAAESVLERIPERALGFVVVNRLSEMDAKLQKLGQEMEMPLPSLLMVVRGSLGIQKGLDEQGSAAAVAMPGQTPDAMPTVVVLLPVSNYQEFIEPFSPEKVSDAVSRVQAMGRPCLVGNKGGYAVCLAGDDPMAMAAVLNTEKSLAEPVKAWQPWLAENDVAAVLTEPGVKWALTRLLAPLEATAAQMSAMGGEMNSIAAAFEMYGNMAKLAREQVAAASVGLLLAKDGDVRLASRARVVNGGTLDRMVSAIKPLGHDALAGLPAGPYAVAISGGLPEEMTTQMQTWSLTMMKGSAGIYGLTDEQAKKLAEASTKTMRRMGGIAMMVGVGKAGEPLYNNIISAMRTDDSRKFLEEYGKQIRAMAEITRGAEKSPFRTIQVEDVKIGDVAALKITMDMAQMLAAQKSSKEAQAMAEAMCGPGGKVTSYVAAADAKTVIFSQLSKDLLLRGLEAMKDPAKSLASDKGVSETAARLPAGAAWVGYVSPRGAIEFARQTMKAFAPQSPGLALAEFPETPPVGFAATVSPGEVHKVMVIPAAVVKALGQYVKTIRPQGQPAK